MRGLDEQHLETPAGERLDAVFDLDPDVRVGNIRKACQIRFRTRMGDGRGVRQAAELGQAAGDVVGGRVEIPRQLGHLGERTAQGLLGAGGGAGGPDDFARLREGGRVVGQHTDRRDPHVEGEIGDEKMDPATGVFREHVAGHGVCRRSRPNRRHPEAVMADDGRHVALDDFADALQNRLLLAVAGGGAVELVDGVKPVEGHEAVDTPGQVVRPGPLQRQRFKNSPAGGQVLGFVVDGAGDHLERDGALADVGQSAADEPVVLLDEAEKAETLGQLHDRAGLGLLRGRALAHLLAGADDSRGIAAAAADVDGNAEPAVVDPHGLFQNVQAHALERGAETRHGLLRRQLPCPGPV